VFCLGSAPRRRGRHHRRADPLRVPGTGTRHAALALIVVILGGVAACSAHSSAAYHRRDYNLRHGTAARSRVRDSVSADDFRHRIPPAGPVRETGRMNRAKWIVPALALICFRWLRGILRQPDEPDFHRRDFAASSICCRLWRPALPWSCVVSRHGGLPLGAALSQAGPGHALAAPSRWLRRR